MSNRLPETRSEMLRARYKLLSRSNCRRCHQPIEWWQTTNGKKLPFDPPPNPDAAYVMEERAKVHPSDCQPTSRPALHELRPDDRKQRVEEIAQQFGARLVLVLDDEGYSYANRLGLDPEDLKQELISAANGIRREMGAGQ